MASPSRGRRELAGQLGLLDDPRAEAGRAKPVAKRRSRRGSRASRGRSRLPSDTTILSRLVRRIFRWLVRFVAFFAMAAIAMTLIYRVIDPPVTPLMLIRPLEGLGEGRLVGIDREWISIDDVSPVLLRSVIASEDGRFFLHNGIDWDAVEAAQKRNERAEKRGSAKLYGASTITMQCARNVFLWQGRNYVRKGLEVLFTYLMELFWGKRRILEVYINVIEWGDGIYGVEAAAQEYFGVSASKLTPRQGALLAAVLPNPRRWSPAKPTTYINGRARTIQARAKGVGLGELDLKE